MKNKKRTWLIKMRKEKGLEQKDVSDLIGTTQQFYSYVENGSRRPSPETAIKLGNVLEFDWRLFYEKKSKLKERAE